jgi:hypothetical protein
MTTGIEVRRDDTGTVAAGTLVLTTNKRNPVLVASGATATVTNLTTAHPASRLTLVITCPKDSIIAITSAVYTVAYSGFYASGQWNMTFLCDCAAGTSIGWMVFAEQALTAGNVGIELYDDTGQIQFGMHPNNKPLRVVDVLNGSPADVSYAAGRTYALGIGKHSGSLIWESGAQPPGGGAPDPSYYIKLWQGVLTRMNGANFEYETMRLDPDPSTFHGTDTPDYSEERDWTQLGHLILDITGY